MFYVYILKSFKKAEQIYIGYTSNLKKRFKEHNDGLSQSTKPYRPWELIFYEAYKSQKDALKREKYFKTTKGKKAFRLMLQNSLE